MSRWMTAALASVLIAGCQKQEGGAPAAPATKAGSLAAKPEAAKPEAAKPEAAKPVAAKPEAAKPEAATPDYKPMFGALPAEMPSPNNPITQAKVDLGRMLYFEKRLSKNHDISCNSCHDLAKFGVDNEPTSPGHKGARGDRNSPTVYNAAGHLAQFWDGRSPDVEDQAKGPVLNPVEMAMVSEAQVLATLKSMPAYVEAFKAAFPDDADPVTYDNFAKAVGAFERKLVTPSRFDQYLKGDETALTNLEKDGLKAFVETGCTTCHGGTWLGGMMYQKLGLVKPWPELKDEGRAAVTKNPAEKGFFKVPALRNVAKTGPYLHDGSVKDLKTMVMMMAEYQLGRQLEPATAESIVAFLETLTGTLPADYIQPPKLPESSPTTPKPDPS